MGRGVEAWLYQHRPGIPHRKELVRCRRGFQEAGPSLALRRATAIADN